jgi:hypothetical protein
MGISKPMSPSDRIRYEDIYRARWEEQTRLDKIKNPKLEIQNAHARNGEKAKAHGHKGGRPKIIKELSKDAAMLNKLLSREISLREAADIMDLTIKSVTQIKSRYGLPRD